MIRLIEILEAGVTDDSGLPLSYGQVYFYDAGTTTLKTVYQDFDLENPHSNPLTLDAAGRAAVYAEDRTKLVIKNAAGATLRTIDNVGTADIDIAAAAVSIGAGNGLSSNTDGELAVNVDGTSITISSDTLSVADGGISTAKLADGSVTNVKLAANAADTAQIVDNAVTTAKINDGAVTQAKRAALGQQLSSSSGSFNTTSATYVDVTNLSVVLVTTGRPVVLMMVPDGTSSQTILGSSGALQGASKFINGSLKFVRDSVDVGILSITGDAQIITPSVPAGPYAVDVPSAGSYTYKVQLKRSTVAPESIALYCSNWKLLAYEL